MFEQKQKGSALVFALIMLSIMIVVAVGSFSASMIDQKTSGDTTKSVSSFQAANTGIEVVLDRVLKNPGVLLTDPLIGAACVGGNLIVSGSVDAGNTKTYKVALLDDAGISVPCATAKTEDVKSLKSVGEFGGTVRAVSVSVESGSNDCIELIPDCGSPLRCTHDGIEYGTVLADDGYCWLDRNLGVTVEPSELTSANDSDGRGWLFQWGRKADGQCWVR